MNKLLVLKDDGSVSIIIPAAEATAELLERDARAVAGYVSHRELSDEELPADRVFRNAWKDGEEGLEIDVEKAKEIKKNEFRDLRAPLLEALDVKFMQALEKNLSTNPVVLQKQALRDVTELSLPDDIEELKEFMPEILLVSE